MTPWLEPHECTLMVQCACRHEKSVLDPSCVVPLALTLHVKLSDEIGMASRSKDDITWFKKISYSWIVTKEAITPIL